MRILVVEDELDIAQFLSQCLREAGYIDLSPREFNLLEYLLRHPTQVLTRTQIAENVWNYDFPGDFKVIDVYVGYLRWENDLQGKLDRDVMEAIFDRLLQEMLLAVTLVLILATISGMFLANRALEPIDRITRTAQEIIDRARAFGGTGLGLAIAYEVVRLHGGSLSVTSQIDSPQETLRERGTTFTISLPQ
jgi:hypothetical protein